jgi:hypothetical protein
MTPQVEQLKIYLKTVLIFKQSFSVLKKKHVLKKFFQVLLMKMYLQTDEK